MFQAQKIYKTLAWLVVVCMVLSTVLPPTQVANAHPQVEDDYALWSSRYHAKANSEDQPSDQVVDALGNIYVTGSSYDYSKNSIVTIAYSSSGMQKWVQQYVNARAFKLGLDAAGNILVSGFTYDAAWKQAGALLLLYSPSGDLLWKKVYKQVPSDTTFTFKSIWDMKIQGEFVWAAGLATDGSRDFPVLYKFNGDGELLWHAISTAPLQLDTSNEDPRLHVETEAQGNAYLAAGIGEASEVTKYDAEGELLWTKSLLTENSTGARLVGIVADAQQQVYILSTALVWEDGYTSCFSTFKLAPDGNLAWHKLDKGYSPRSIALDPKGDIYLGGGDQGATQLYKYSPAGDLLWQYRFLGGNSSAFMHAAHLTFSGNFVYVVDSDFNHLLKMNTDGKLLWFINFPGYGENVAGLDMTALGDVVLSTNYEMGEILTISYPAEKQPFVWVEDAQALEGNLEAENNVLVFTAHLSKPIKGQVSLDYIVESGTATEGTDYAAEEASGRVIFEEGETEKTFSISLVEDLIEEIAQETLSLKLTAASNVNLVHDHVYGTIVDDDGNDSYLWDIAQPLSPNWIIHSSRNELLVDQQGNSYLSSFNRIYKYDPSGARQWEFIQDGEIYKTIFDDQGQMYFVGAKGASILNEDGDRSPVLVKMAPDGTKLWEKAEKVVPSQGTYTDIKPDPDGNLVVLGNLYDPGKNTQMLILKKFNSNGDVFWEQRIPGIASYGAKLDVDLQGQVYIGLTLVEQNEYTFMFNRYSAEGELVWSMSYPASSDLTNGITGMAVSKAGILFVNTQLGWSLALSPNSEFVSIPSYGGSSGGGNNWTGPVYEDMDGNIYITGYFYASQHYTYLSKLTPQGKEYWSRVMPFGYAPQLAFDAHGNVFMVSDAEGSQGTSGIWLVGFDANGKTILSQNPALADIVMTKGAGIDGQGGLYALAERENELVIAKFDVGTRLTLPSIQLSGLTAVEPESESGTLRFTVRLTSPLPAPVTLQYRTVGGTAYPGYDYQDVSGNITIPANQTSAVIEVPILADTWNETEEIFFLSLTTPTGTPVSQSMATGRIIDSRMKLNFLPVLGR